MPLLLALVSDLFFGVQIETVGRALGFTVRTVTSGAEIEPDAPPAQVAGQSRAFLGEPLTGRGAGFVARLVEWQPVLVLIELSSRQIPWADWVAAMKAAAATRRIPVVGFGPHVDTALRRRALDAGCDAVVPKSRLAAGLPDLIAQYARQADASVWVEGCQGQLSELALKGLSLFNAGRYFEAHEELELAWNAESGPVRELYRGILQVGVAYLHITRHNYRGALKLFLRMRQWLDPLPDECQGIDVRQLRADAQAARQHLETLGEERIEDFDRALLRPVVYKHV